MIEGDAVTFSSGNFQNDMVTIKNKNDVFSLLVCLGYLSCSDTQNRHRKIAYVPNAEIRAALMAIAREQNWYPSMENVKRSEKLLKAIMELDGTTTAKLIQDIRNSAAVSLLDYNDEEYLASCITTVFCGQLLMITDVIAKSPQAKGHADLVYEPLTGKLPPLLIEFRYNNSAEETLKQIKTKEYFKRYARQYRNIILAGINYSAETKA